MEDFTEYKYIQDVEEEKVIEQPIEIIKEEPKKEFKKTPKYLEKKCKVLITTKNYSIVDFDGCGIRVNKTNEKFITVKYVGTMGQSDFQIIE